MRVSPGTSGDRPAVLFDLDGTVVDPAGGITQGIAYALRSMDLAVPADSVLDAMVGPKLAESLLRLPGFPAELLPAVIERYRQWYISQGIAMGRPYPGIPELLRTLNGWGVPLALATQKPLSLAKVLLSTHGLSECFQVVSGSAEDESAQTDDTAPPKQLIIATALQGLGYPERAVMVGDRSHDVLGARANQLDCIGVLWGFSAPGELADAGALHTVGSAAELETFLVEYFALEVVHGAL